MAIKLGGESGIRFAESRTAMLFKSNLRSIGLTVFEAHCRCCKIQEPSSISHVSNQSPASFGVLQELGHPGAASERVVSAQVFHIEHFEAGPLRFVYNIREMRQLATGKHASLQEQCRGPNQHTFRTNDSPVKKDTAVGEERMNLSEVFAQMSAPDVFKHPDRGNLVEASLKVAVISLFDGHPPVQAVVSHDSSGEFELSATQGATGGLRSES